MTNLLIKLFYLKENYCHSTLKISSINSIIQIIQVFKLEIELGMFDFLKRFDSKSDDENRFS